MLISAVPVSRYANIQGNWVFETLVFLEQRYLQNPSRSPDSDALIGRVERLRRAMTGVEQRLRANGKLEGFE